MQNVQAVWTSIRQFITRVKYSSTIEPNNTHFSVTEEK